VSVSVLRVGSFRDRKEVDISARARVFVSSAGNVSLSVSVGNNSSLLVEWDSGSKHTTQCALLISTEGTQEIQIHLVPRLKLLTAQSLTNKCFKIFSK